MAKYRFPMHAMTETFAAAEPSFINHPPHDQSNAVLARKYRPENFDNIIGQDAVVTILRRALEQNRVAQAMVFHGIRGTGKTTLARIVAKGLNCEAVEAPTATPCGQCRSCQDIAAGQNLDVQEIDAASHTGVDHIRELIASVGYSPAGRYKVYILDEVHMLSTSAFNALLKTLEEPPAHVKFMFATTELHKIPATVLSRTQRFTLKRVGASALLAWLSRVVEQEGKTADDTALRMIARAGEGSVRDSLSLLDQLLSGVSRLDYQRVCAQLGKADMRISVLMLRALFAQQATELLQLLQQQHDEGYDALAMVEDMMLLSHQLSRYKVLKQDDDALGPAEQEFVREMSTQLNMSMLARLWQLLLVGVQEIRQASSPMIALEMLMIRALYLANVPTPGQILASAPTVVPAVTPAAPPAVTSAAPPAIPSAVEPSVKSAFALSPPVESEADPETPNAVEPADDYAEDQAYNQTDHPATSIVTAPDIPAAPMAYSFKALIALLEQHQEGHLASLLRVDARLHTFADCRFSLYINPKWRAELNVLSSVIERITHKPWQIDFLDSSEGCQDTVAQQEEIKQAKLLEAARQDSTMQEIQQMFPTANLVALNARSEQE